MDGVLTDWADAAAKLFNVPKESIVNWDTYTNLGISELEFCETVERNAPAFWIDMLPCPWWRYLYDELVKRARVTILTSPMRHPYCAYGKIVWLQKHFGNTFIDFLIGKPKECCAHSDAILIDDKNENCDAFVEYGGHSILFPQPWNRNKDKIDFRMTYTLDQLDKLLSRNLK